MIYQFTWYRPEGYVPFQIFNSNATKNSFQLVQTKFPSFYSFFSFILFFSHKSGFFFQGVRSTIIGFPARAFLTDINILACNLL